MNVLEKMKLNGQLNDIYLEIVGVTSVLEKMKLNGQINDIYLKLNAGGIDTPSTPDAPSTPDTLKQYDDKTDALEVIGYSLSDGYINLAGAKKRLKDLLTDTATSLDPALVELINDAINTNGRNKVLPKLEAAISKSKSLRDAARKANTPKVDPLVEHAELIALAKSHGFSVDVDKNDNTIYFEAPQATSGTSADLDDPDEIESFIYDLENAVEKWKSEEQARENARFQSRIEMMNRGKKPNLWKIDIPDKDDWAWVSTPLSGYFDEQYIEFFIKYAPDGSDTLNLNYSGGGVLKADVETFDDVVNAITNELTTDKVNGLYPELQGNDDLLPGGETYNDMPKEAQAMIDQTVANFPDLMPADMPPATDGDQQYVDQLNALKALTISDFNTLGVSESKAKFYDILDQQETIVMKLIELDKIDEHTPLILAVGEHIATLKAESVNL